MSYEMVCEESGFCVRHSGHVTFEEIAEANDRIIEHAAWETHDYQIWSFLDASALDADKRDTRVISKVDEMSHRRARAKPIKVAFVSTNARTNEVIGAYIDSVDATMFDAKLFRTEGDARAWAGA